MLKYILIAWSGILRNEFLAFKSQKTNSKTKTSRQEKINIGIYGKYKSRRRWSSLPAIGRRITTSVAIFEPGSFTSRCLILAIRPSGYHYQEYPSYNKVWCYYLQNPKILIHEFYTKLCGGKFNSKINRLYFLIEEEKYN